MKYCYIILLILSSNLAAVIASAQLTATISPNITICAGQTASVTFTGSGGVAPYHFSYTVNGGNVNTISSGAGNAAVVSGVFTQSGTFSYTLVSVEDANTTEALNLNSTVSVMPNPIVNAGSDQTVCAGTSVTLIVSGGFGCTYTWSNGIMGNTPFLPMATTTYTVTGTCGGCSASDQVTVHVLPFDPPVATALIDSAACHDGSLAITISGSNPPYTVDWGSIGNGAMLSPLAAGDYTAVITDGSGCSMDTVFTVPASLLPPDCGAISGTVRYDENQNCTADIGDAPIANRMIVVNPGNFIAFTDSDGHYELYLDPGNYTVEELFNNTGFGSVCNASQQASLVSGQTINGIDFLDTISGGSDYQALNSLTTGLLYMGYLNFAHTVNDLTGYQGLENLTGWFTIPPQLSLLPWNVPHTISNDTVYYAIDTNVSVLTYHVVFDLTAVEPGDTVSFCSGVISQFPEGNLLNNVYCQNDVVIGPYDPNDITMLLNGTPGDSTILETDMSLDYRIRFQNTGTAEALNVYVLDTISDHLDLSSFQLISASHNCQVSLLEGRVLKFDFPQIHLPDSNTNEAASHGFIYYRIRQKPSNPVGSVILNTAYIYFDFNDPVVTNTSYEKIISDAGLKENEPDQITVYPNPSNGEFRISDFPSQSKLYMTVTDINGRQLIPSIPLKKSFTIEAEQGIYFLNITDVETGRGSVKRLLIGK